MYKSRIPKSRLTKYILGIILILAVIIISLMTACSGAEAPATYQYQVPAELGDGWETDSLVEVWLDSEVVFNHRFDEMMKSKELNNGN